MVAIQRETFTYGELEMPYWGVSVPCAVSKSNRIERYVPFGLMSRLIGVDAKFQAKVVRKKYPRSMQLLPLETVKGIQQAQWIRCQECALWIGDIDPAKCSITSRGPLTKFKADFAEAADKLLFEGPKQPIGKRGIIVSSERHEYVFSCLYCGGGHRIITQNGEVTIEKYVV